MLSFLQVVSNNWEFFNFGEGEEKWLVGQRRASLLAIKQKIISPICLQEWLGTSFSNECPGWRGGGHELEKGATQATSEDNE